MTISLSLSSKMFYIFILLLQQLFLSDSSSHNSFYTTPRLISSVNNGAELKIGLTAGSDNLVLVLHKNKELTSAYKIYTQDSTGNLIPSRKPPHCQYLGHVEGYKSSLVILSNCDGLSGKIQYSKVEYRIRPVKLTTKYDRESHTAYGQDSSEVQKTLDYKVTQLHELFEPPVYDEEHNFGHIETGEYNHHKDHEKAKKRIKRLTLPTMSQDEIMKVNVKKLARKFLEVAVVVDRKQHQLLGNNKQKTTDWVETVVNNIASKFKPYNVIVAMVSLTIWNERNEIQMPNNYSKILDAFAEYRQNILQPKTASDISTLITGEPFFEPHTIGGANTGTLCDALLSVNINYDTRKGQNVPYLSTLIAHEIGHVMGMYHDTDEKFQNERNSCECPCRREDFNHTAGYTPPDFCGANDRCILFHTINRDYEHFSLCSRRVLEEELGYFRCLSNSPQELDGNAPTCGNAVVEAGEACDCGSDEDCPILDPCCEVGLCQLKNTSSCFTGPCCSDACQFKEKGTVCRKNIPGMECDFEEVCTGSDSSCPIDTYKQDGRQCKDGDKKDGYCSTSDCMTHQSQCRELFGKYAWEAPREADLCWKLNEDGSWQGNCGYVTEGEKANYLPCKPKNTQCGLLQCMIRAEDALNAKLEAKKLGSFRTTFGSRNPTDDEEYPYRCASMRYEPAIRTQEDDEYSGFVDRGQVADYTGCGAGLFCYQKECTYHAPTTCPGYNGSECGGHGQCNNLNQCHCDKNWGSDICVDFKRIACDLYPEKCRKRYLGCIEITEGSGDNMTVIIVLVIVAVIAPCVVGVAVYIVKHKVDMKKIRELDRTKIARGIRRFSSRAFSRQGSTTSSGGGGSGSRHVKMANVTKYTRVPKVSDTVTTKPLTSKTGLRVPPPPPPSKPSPTPPTRPAKPAYKPFTSPTSSNCSTGSGPPPPVPPPPPPSGAKAVLRSVRDGLRPARLDDRTHSESFKNAVKVPLDTLASSSPLSDPSLHKKTLQAPRHLAGRSRQSKKLQISGPTNDSLLGLDGRPKSLHSATLIQNSSDSINTVSSTRALFEPNTQKKGNSRWK